MQVNHKSRNVLEEYGSAIEMTIEIVQECDCECELVQNIVK